MFSANCLAQSNFSRSLCNRNQHYVHDADAAYQQRNSGDNTEERRQNAGHLTEGTGNFLLAQHGEIILVPVGDTMLIAQHQFNLGDGGLLPIFTCYLSVN